MIETLCRGSDLIRLLVGAFLPSLRRELTPPAYLRKWPRELVAWAALRQFLQVSCPCVGYRTDGAAP